MDDKLTNTDIAEVDREGFVGISNCIGHALNVLKYCPLRSIASCLSYSVQKDDFVTHRS